MKTKSAMITIAGRPNVGKSTLTNALVGEKIAIVSNKPQTTRNRICAIVNRENTQLVFIDTPGFHRPRTKLGDYMVKAAADTLGGVDLAVLVVEAREAVGDIEEGLLAKIRSAGIPAILVINKTDTVRKENIAKTIRAYADAFDFAAVVPLSAKNGHGVDTLLSECEKFLYESDWFFPSDIVTDQPERQIAAEIVRRCSIRMGFSAGTMTVLPSGAVFFTVISLYSGK